MCRPKQRWQQRMGPEKVEDDGELEDSVSFKPRKERKSRGHKPRQLCILRRALKGMGVKVGDSSKS